MWILSNNKKNSEIKLSLQSLWQTSYTKGNVKRHIESVQEKDKYQCNQCEYKTEAQGPLNNHIESVHEKVKHDCNLYEYEAAENVHLHLHMLTIISNIITGNLFVFKIGGCYKCCPEPCHISCHGCTCREQAVSQHSSHLSSLTEHQNPWADCILSSTPQP